MKVPRLEGRDIELRSGRRYMRRLVALPQLQPRIALAQSELLVEQSAWLAGTDQGIANCL